MNDLSLPLISNYPNLLSIIKRPTLDKAEVDLLVNDKISSVEIPLPQSRYKHNTHTNL